MQLTKPKTKRKRKSSIQEGKDFVKEKIHPLFDKFGVFFERLSEKYPDLIKTPQDLRRWENVFYCKVGPLDAEKAAMAELATIQRGIVRAQLQRKIDELESK